MTYNSQSGHTTLCGARTKKVVAFKVFSKLCRTCDDHKKKNNDEKVLPAKHRCPKNWTESSKAMEPNGILDCVIKVWNSGIAWMYDFISDDNSSSRSIIKHPILIQIAKDIIKKWPVDKHGKDVKCTGRLPAEINAMGVYHVDPSHRRHVYGSHLYKLERKLTEMKKTDCECLVCNFGYAVKQNREKSFEEFEKAMKAALEHHFDNHEYCNPTWCQFREDSVQKSADTVRAKFRNINVNPANKVVYDEVKKYTICIQHVKTY